MPLNKTGIGWTDFTWTTVHGCSRASPGCDNCYAESMSLRYGITKLPWTRANAKHNVQLKYNKLRQPYQLKEPSRIFVNSMGDTFHPNVPDSFLGQIFEVMNDCTQHIFQVLTKRPRRAAEYPGPWTDNIWQGTSIESQDTLYRLDRLRLCPAKIKFVSFEPLLEDLGVLDLTGINWVIAGGESGYGHRQMDHAWARSIRDQCVKQGIPFFFKQSANYRPETGTKLQETDGTHSKWQQFPETLEVVSPNNGQLTLF